VLLLLLLLLLLLISHVYTLHCEQMKDGGNPTTYDAALELQHCAAAVAAAAATANVPSVYVTLQLLADKDATHLA
jgi:hypothetical protein